MASSSLSLSLSKSLSTRLRLRAVLLDERVHALSPLEPRKARRASFYGALEAPIRCVDTLLRRGETSALLTGEVREALHKRGLPIIGKRWEVEERLKQSLAKQPWPGSPVVGEDTSAPDATTDLSSATSKPAAVATSVPRDGDKANAKKDVRSKYMAALEAKRRTSARHSASDTHVAAVPDTHAFAEQSSPMAAGAANASNSYGGGAQHDNHASGSTTKASASASGAWNFRPGTRELLQYIDTRGMIRGLIRDDTDEAAETAHSAEPKSSTAAQASHASAASSGGGRGGGGSSSITSSTPAFAADFGAAFGSPATLAYAIAAAFAIDTNSHTNAYTNAYTSAAAATRSAQNSTRRTAEVTSWSFVPAPPATTSATNIAATTTSPTTASPATPAPTSASASPSSHLRTPPPHCALSESLRVPPFSFNVAADRRADSHSTRAMIQSACDAAKVPPDAILVVSDHAPTINAVRRLGIGVATCYFRKQIPGVAQAIPADFIVSEMVEIRHAIEDLNGFSFRDGSAEIRSGYGVNSTA